MEILVKKTLNLINPLFALLKASIFFVLILIDWIAIDCLQFYYHLYGDEIGELNLKRKKSSDGLVQDQPIWRRNQQHGNIWLRAHVTVESFTEAYSFVFEAVVGKGYKGNVAIDEIVFTENRRCLPIAEVSDLVGHYCDFEGQAANNICNYTVLDANTWTKAKPMIGFGRYPKYDNTYQTSVGSFMQYVSIIYSIYHNQHD